MAWIASVIIFTLLLCAQFGDPNICSRIHRAPSGSLWTTTAGFVSDLLTNIGSVRTKGIDLDAGYRINMGRAGRLDFAMLATRNKSFETTPQAGATYDCAGYYGGICGAPQPKWRQNVRAAWATPLEGLDVALTWRYLGAVDLDALSPGLKFLGASYGTAAQGAGGVIADPTKPPATDLHFASRGYVDLSGSYRFAGKYAVRLGVNNLTDKSPPVNGASTCPVGQCNGNTFPVVYDANGRFFFGTVTANF